MNQCSSIGLAASKDANEAIEAAAVEFGRDVKKLIAIRSGRAVGWGP
jgi:hypothetical protein